MEKVMAYRATDGTLLSTEEQCEEYEVSLAWRERIEDFFRSSLNPYPAGTYGGMCKKIVLAWETFKTKTGA